MSVLDYRNFIDGRFIDSGERFEDIDPAGQQRPARRQRRVEIRIASAQVRHERGAILGPAAGEGFGESGHAA